MKTITFKCNCCGTSYPVVNRDGCYAIAPPFEPPCEIPDDWVPTVLALIGANYPDGKAIVEEVTPPVAV